MFTKIIQNCPLSPFSCYREKEIISICNYRADKYLKIFPCLEFSDRYVCSDIDEASLLFLSMHTTHVIHKCHLCKCVISDDV
jgi:hypothetical protein